MSSFSRVEMPQKNVIPTYTAAKILMCNTTAKSKYKIITVNTVCARQEISTERGKNEITTSSGY
jgi:hypothetical protein